MNAITEIKKSPVMQGIPRQYQDSYATALLDELQRRILARANSMLNLRNMTLDRAYLRARREVLESAGLKTI